MGCGRRGQCKLHWRDETARRRKLLTAAVAELEALHLVVVRVDAHAGSERRRRVCLRRLLAELGIARVSEVFLESREATQNARDRQLLDVLCAQRALTGGIQMQRPPGHAEPLL